MDVATRNIAEVRSFIDRLELAEPTPELARLIPAAPRLVDTEKGGYVDDGSMVSFVAGLSATHKSDVLNSTLLAQLAANKQFDREEKTEAWYDFYRTVLENVGWVIQAFDFTRFETAGATFSVDEVVVKILAAIATQNDIAVVTETLEAMKALTAEDGRVVLFNQESHSLQKGNFQIGVCSESDGVVVMKIGTFYFSTTQQVTRLLWMQFSSSESGFYQGAQTVNLNEEVYAQVRQQVVDKLGDKARTFVADLDI